MDLEWGEVQTDLQEDLEIVAQGKRVSDGAWETLGSDFANGTRALWWAENATPGVFSAYRTVRVTTKVSTETEALILIGGSK